jgi:hypothetical protein
LLTVELAEHDRMDGAPRHLADQRLIEKARKRWLACRKPLERAQPQAPSALAAETSAALAPGGAKLDRNVSPGKSRATAGKACRAT